MYSPLLVGSNALDVLRIPVSCGTGSPHARAGWHSPGRSCSHLHAEIREDPDHSRGSAPSECRRRGTAAPLPPAAAAAEPATLQSH